MSGGPSAAQWHKAVLDAASAITPHTLQGTPPAGVAGTFPPMPWSVGSKGSDYLSSPSGAIVGSLAETGTAFVATPGGQSLAAQIAAHDWSKSTDPALAQQVESNGIFGPALSQIKADQLLRSFSVGGAGGVQVVVGGEGGGGYIWDMAASDTGGYVYGFGKLGLGGQVGAGMLLGAWSRTPAQMSGSTAALQLGANIGAGAVVTVVMDFDLNLAGFTVQVGVGAGLSATVAYGSMTTT